MATPRNDDRTVTRTYRAAIRLGEDFITIEETITLLVGASDDDVSKAVDLGLRIYQAQREAVDAQVSLIRDAAGTPPAITVRDPEAPASDKQRNFIANLQENLGWSGEQLSGHASTQNIDLVTLTKGQASTFIDGLKKLAEERQSYGEAAKPRAEAPRAEARPSDEPMINDKQVVALEKVAQQRGLDIEAEAQRRFGASLQSLTAEQASGMLRDLQRAPQQRRTAEPAL